MKRFLLKCLLFLILLIIVSIISIQLPDYRNEGTLIYALEDKHALIKKIKEPKVVFVGGSNLSFGLDTKRISQEMGMPAYNLGIHAGFGLRFMLEDSKKFIKEGDLVVVIPEYSQFLNNYWGSGVLINALFDIYPEGMKHISGYQFTKLADEIPRYVGNKYYHFLKGTIKRRDTSKVHIYHRRSFNEFGDATVHLDLPNTKFSKSRLKGDPQKKIINEFNAYSAYVESKKATCVFIYPVYHEESFDKSHVFHKKLKVALKKHQKFRTISTPEAYKYENDYFFNSEYHLNKKGIERRTTQIIEDLKGI